MFDFLPKLDGAIRDWGLSRFPLSLQKCFDAGDAMTTVKPGLITVCAPYTPQRVYRQTDLVREGLEFVPAQLLALGVFFSATNRGQ